VNTEFKYMYRDASNYKKSTHAVFAGTLTGPEKADLLNNFDQGMFFIPEQVGLENPRDDFENHYEDDHIWNEVLEVTSTEQAPTDTRTIAEFYAELQSIAWDPHLAYDVLKTWMNDTPNGATLLEQ
jgi:hypothetical protein